MSPARSSIPTGLFADRGGVQLWLRGLPDRAALDAADLAILDSGERERMERSVRSEVGIAFGLAHAFLRRVLGRVSGVYPGAVVFRIAEGGRPEILVAPLDDFWFTDPARPPIRVHFATAAAGNPALWRFELVSPTPDHRVAIASFVVPRLLSVRARGIISRWR